jgi:hypothetical protein
MVNQLVDGHEQLSVQMNIYLEARNSILLELEY